MVARHRGMQIAAIIALLAALLPAFRAQAQETSHYFAETKQTVRGRFLEYWNTNGGLMQQGYPISGELEEKSAIDGKTYTVQYFERAVFEKHPENAKPYDVLLSLLGVQRFLAKYSDGTSAQQANNEAGSILFPETGKRVGGSFLSYFNQYGGVAQQGLPITNEFEEKSDLDGRVRRVQYFQRAVMELNPDNKPPYDVLLAQLGTFAYKAAYHPDPGTVEPMLPAPLDRTKQQLSPVASGRYMVWNEGHVNGSYGQSISDFDIRALDLATNQPILVTDAQGNQVTFALDGSLVAWKSENFDCGPCPPNGISAMDLATGQAYSIALDYQSGSSSFTLLNPAVSGRNVSWLQIGGNYQQHLFTRNVDTGKRVELRTLVEGTPDVQTRIGNVQGSGRFLVWSERSDTFVSQNEHGSLYPFSIHAYDFTTNSQFVVYRNDLPGAISTTDPLYSISGDNLVLADKMGNLTLVNLITHAETSIPIVEDVYDLHLYGNTLLISTAVDPLYISSLDISKPDQGAWKQLEPELATEGPALPRYSATVVGDWLVWSNATAPMPALKEKRLDTPSEYEPINVRLPSSLQPAKYRSYYVEGYAGSTIIYWDCPVSGLFESQPPCRLRGYDWATLKSNPYVPDLTPDDAAEVVAAPGSWLVWRLVNHPDCANCPAPGIYAVNLANGKYYTVVTGLESRYGIAAYGFQVVWIEQDENVRRVMGKNLETGEFTNYRELDDSSITIANLQISYPFMVWNEQNTQDVEGKKSRIVALNTQTAEMSTIHSYDWTRAIGNSTRISLDATRVPRVALLVGDSFFVYNLQTEERINLDGSQYVVWLQLKDGMVVYGASDFGPGVYGIGNASAIYALPLNNPSAVKAVIPFRPVAGDSYFGVMAGTTLIYTNRTAQQPRMMAVQLPYELMYREKP